MIKSALYHALFAVLIQLVLSPLIGMLGGASAGVMYYVGREVAQHEHRGGGPKVVPWYYGFINHWTLDSILDVLFPIIATGAVWLLF